MNHVLWWIRRDLRVNHNPTLKAALKDGNVVIPVFILDEHLLSTPATNRQRFLFAGLQSLTKQLKERGCGLVIRRGDAAAELQKLMWETGAVKVFAEEDYSPYARKRDERVAAVLPLQLVNGLTIFHPSSVLKNDGTPYTVFTPYSRTWKAMPFPYEDNFHIPAQLPTVNLPVSETLPDFDAVSGFPTTEVEAARRLDNFLQEKVDNYQDDRNRMDLDGTSELSPYLRFGMLSAREAAARVRALPGSRGTETWLNEIIWREFYQSILYHFPFVARQAFNPKLRNIAWRHAPSDFEAWKEGRTGYPVVDAAMRQLSSTGWMHNRARMITASFLSKDLLINWQEGEAWFMQQLVDGDTAANNGGWQWTAGTGTDAAPYFRIFNPVLQSMKFDPVGTYIRQYVPELHSVPDKWIHEPWKMPESMQISVGVRIGKNYPAPIVDHQIVKERTLSAYKAGQL